MERETEEKGRRNENGNKLRMMEKGRHESRERIRG